MNIYKQFKRTVKGGLVGRSESAETSSTMINRSCSVEKCTRKPFMRLSEREIYPIIAVFDLSIQVRLHKAVQTTPTKHGLQLGLANIQKNTYSLVSAVFSFGATVPARKLKNRLCTHISVSPPPGMRQHRHPRYSFTRVYYPPPTPTAPPTRPQYALNIASFRDYLEISFRFQLAPERGVAFQVAILGNSIPRRVTLYGKLADLYV